MLIRKPKMATSASENQTNPKPPDDPRATVCPDADVEAARAAVPDKLPRSLSERDIYHLLGHAPGLFPHLIGVRGGCFDGKRRAMRQQDWQLMVQRTNKTLGAKFAYDVAIPVERVEAMPRAKLAAIGCSAADVRAGKGPWTDRDRAILRVVDEQLETYTNKQETLKDALAVLGSEDLVEVLMVMGTYALIAKVIRGLKMLGGARTARA